MTEQKYDSRADTLAHIRRVQNLLQECVDKLDSRAFHHDESKLHEPEKSVFDECTAKLKAMAYGTPEYKEALKELGPALQHHYEANSHHPEHFPKTEYILSGLIRAQGEVKGPIQQLMPEAAQALIDYADQAEAPINGMSLFDVIEMLMDWKAATERMKGGGDIYRSLEINTERFKLTPQLRSILMNTIIEMQWPKPATT